MELIYVVARMWVLPDNGLPPCVASPHLVTQSVNTAISWASTTFFELFQTGFHSLFQHSCKKKKDSLRTYIFFTKFCRILTLSVLLK